jgi:pilus assembly protein CpaE
VARTRIRTRRQRAPDTDSERGQATVEFLGVLPAALLVVLAGWQAALAGQTVWLAGNAARVAARARSVGHDPEAAARSALPSYLRRRLVVRSAGDRVFVRVGLPLLVKRWPSPLRLRAVAAMERQ